LRRACSKVSPPNARRLLRSLHLVGLDFLDPVVLAALADERPLLLIGPHGNREVGATEPASPRAWALRTATTTRA